MKKEKHQNEIGINVENFIIIIIFSPEWYKHVYLLRRKSCIMDGEMPMERKKDVWI